LVVLESRIYDVTKKSFCQLLNIYSMLFPIYS
jgi:hypothetical protein